MSAGQHSDTVGQRARRSARGGASPLWAMAVLQRQLISAQPTVRFHLILVPPCADHLSLCRCISAPRCLAALLSLSRFLLC